MRRLTEWLRAARAPRHALAAETLVVLLVALAALALAWQAPGPITVEAGRSDEVLLTHFDSVERVDGRAYRWSERDASMRFPGLGVQDWRVTLVAAAGARPGGPPRLTIRAGFELGTGVDVNTYAPERAASDLRAALGD